MSRSYRHGEEHHSSRQRSRSPAMEKQYHHSNSSESNTIYRIPPFYYIHVLNQTTNVSSVEIGPQTFVRQDNQRVVLGPNKMVVVPPRHYCIINNPICRNDEGNPIIDKYGQVKLNHGEQEVRLSREPFALYPGEILKEKVSPLKVVPANSALRLRAVLDFDDDDGVKRTAGDEWLFEGPGTFIPQKEILMEETVRATIIGPGQALKLRARKDYVDREGINRVTGELWMVKKTGAHLPSAYDEVLELVNAYVLTDKTAIHMRATKTFVDDFAIERKNGEEWLITLANTESHIPHVYEELVSVVDIHTLTNRQYCIILNAVGDDGKPQLGRKKLVRGEKSFFLMPGESLERGIQNVYILEEDEGLILRAYESFKDGNVSRQPGDRWMIRGPTEYVPPVEVEVVTKRKAIPLDETEGIYVRDVKTGRVRMIHGQTYMLNQDEELWEKELSPTVEILLTSGNDPLADRGSWRLKNNEKTLPATPRDKTRVVSFRVPHNAAVQIYDYKEKTPRVIFGPELVMLGPDEQFTQLSLSGGKPKKANVIKSLCLLLGPDFCTDTIVVETADHAKLSLQLAYNWHFDVASKTPEEASKLFSVPDFIGDSCKAIASKVRGAVAQVQFDTFHKNSSRLIQSAVFGLDENGKMLNCIRFNQNNLVITSVDIQSVEPVDQRTRDALMKSVQLAIEITTKSQEATAKQEAERLEQEARGRLERQKIMDEAEAEKARKELLQLQANSAAVESTGQAKAEAQSKAEASRIAGEAAVQSARLQAEASAIKTDSELNRLKRARTAEIEYTSEQNKLEIEKTAEISRIEISKFKEMVESIGSNTLLSMATAGPDLQVRMLQALGLKSTLITDGSSPINLFNTASGLIGGDMIPKKRRRVEVSVPTNDQAGDADSDSDS